SLQVHVALGPGDECVRRGPQLLDQAQLLERRFELGTENAPLDSLERAERGLDRRALAIGAEVGAQPSAKVARAPDVEHEVAGAVEEVDARPWRCAESQVPLVPDAPRPRRGERDEVGARSRT